MRVVEYGIRERETKREKQSERDKRIKTERENTDRKRK